MLPTNNLTPWMDTTVISVLVGTDQEECARIMSCYDLLALPVVDHNGLLNKIVDLWHN